MNKYKLLEIGDREKNEIIVSGYAQKIYGKNCFSSELTYRIIEMLTEKKIISREEGLISSSLVNIEGDKFYKYLHSYCKNYAFTLVNSSEIIEEVSHESLITIFNEDQKIYNLKGWLKQTVHNRVMTILKKESLERRKIKEFSEYVKQSYDDSEMGNSSSLIIKKEELVRYMSPNDYAMYQKINKYKSLKEYAIANGISYNTARIHSHKVIRNIRAALSRKIEGEWTKEILTYNQSCKLNRFLSRLSYLACHNKLEKLSKYCSKLVYHHIKDLVNEIIQFSEWNIKYIEKDDYHLRFLCNKKIFVMRIRILAMERISILSCEKYDNDDLYEFTCIRDKVDKQEI